MYSNINRLKTFNYSLRCERAYLRFVLLYDPPYTSINFKNMTKSESAISNPLNYGLVI